MSRHARVLVDADDVVEVSAHEMETYQLTMEDDRLAVAFRINAKLAARRPHHESVHRAQRRAVSLANHVAKYEIASPVSSPRSSYRCFTSCSFGSFVCSGDETTLDDIGHYGVIVSSGVRSDHGNTKDAVQSRDVAANVRNDAHVRGGGPQLSHDDSGSYSFDSVVCSGDDVGNHSDTVPGGAGSGHGSTKDVAKLREIGANVRKDARVRGGGRRLSSLLWKQCRQDCTRVVPENCLSEMRSHGEHQERVPHSSRARKKISSILRRTNHANKSSEIQRNFSSLVSPTGAANGHSDKFDHATSDDFADDSDLPGEGDRSVRQNQSYLSCYLKTRMAGLKNVIDRGRVSAYSRK
eukprot:TRINITY_DN8869_c0_g1_i1.p1 TRINITY_DN8869_c0_g1~~TRINITY_DN8869_c0_g1_i1.p1  ORF type:complete len:352 (-),score=27.11 TRINITY_DN8869_c0_g1_i1:96-1151(-)